MELTVPISGKITPKALQGAALMRIGGGGAELILMPCPDELCCTGSCLEEIKMYFLQKETSPQWIDREMFLLESSVCWKERTQQGLAGKSL